MKYFNCYLKDFSYFHSSVNSLVWNVEKKSQNIREQEVLSFNSFFLFIKAKSERQNAQQTDRLKESGVHK